jgi:hypothetical protein
MRFFVIERAKASSVLDSKELVKLAAEDLKYKRRLEKQGKIVGGLCLDVLADGHVPETKTIEEMDEIFFNSPTNFVTEKEVNPLGTFKDSLEGMVELRKGK